MKKYKVGYTAGVFDMFHVGHLNLLRNAKEMCEYLIVGVNSDELVYQYKGKKAVINEIQRREIVNSIKYVDWAEIVNTLDKVDAYSKYKFDVIFIGDDWKGSERWNQTERDLARFGVKVIYLPYTKNLSSTQLRGCCQDKIDEL